MSSWEKKEKARETKLAEEIELKGERSEQHFNLVIDWLLLLKRLTELLDFP